MVIDSSAFCRPSNRSKLGLCLILISSALLGIWAVKGTIALRHILLYLGFTVSTIYLVCCLLQEKNLREGLTIRKFLPLIMLGLMFIWVVAHYFFLTRDSERHFDEITTTWLRTFLGAGLAVGTALEVSKRPNLLIWLWAGIFVSFLVLLYQYAPIALAKKNLYQVDWYGPSYIYIGKINGVLSGVTMSAGLIGSLKWWSGPSASQQSYFRIISSELFCILGVALVCFSYVYIFDARNGIITQAITSIIAVILLGFSVRKQKNKTKFNRLSIFHIALILSMIAIVSYFSIQQRKSNFDWRSVIEDAGIAVQIYKNPHWRDPEGLGFPKTASGKVVSISVYQRVSWFTAGLVIFVPEYPLGIGTLDHVFPRLLYKKYGKEVDDAVPSTHSAFLDLTLSYGLPGLFLMMGPLFLILYRSVRQKQSNSLKEFIIIMSIAILWIYIFGELGSGHGLEILVYWIAFLSTLQLFSVDLFQH